MSFVTKRDGRKEAIHFDKITKRINHLINPIELHNIKLSYLNIKKETEYLDPVLVAQKVVAILYSGITTEELDIASANICINLSTVHPSYAYLGGRILVSNLHKKTKSSFTEKMEILANTTKVINNDFLQWVKNNSEIIDNMIDYNRDYLYDYFGFKTLEKSYLLKSNGKIIERPQDMLMRTAITLQQGNLELIKKTYDVMSLGYYTHASPTLFNSGTNHMQMSSCFVENTEVMTINGIKNIQDIEIGDEVVTHTGEKHKVLQLHKNLLNDRKVMKLIVHKTKPIYVTEDHKFWTVSKVDLEPKWRPIKELSNDNYIAIPSYNGVLKIEIVDSIHINSLIAKLMGMYMIYGHYIIENAQIAGIKFLLCQHNKEEIEFISKVFPDNKPIYYKIPNCGSLIYLIFKDHNIGSLFYNMFGEKKHIWKNMVNWDIELITAFQSGLVFASGGYGSSNSIIIKLANQYITNQLYHLFRMYGINVGVLQANNQLQFYDDENQIIINNVKFMQVNKIIETQLKPKYVYTIGVENDHSYNVEGLICENCFLLGTNDDLTDIATTWNSCAQISKWAGGIGLHVSNIRGKSSLIKGTNGLSNGLVPFLRVFNDIARWIDQGGKRPGSIAIYLEPHHPDIFEFLDLRKNFGSDMERARDLFLALWISDLFMKQVEADGDWYLLSADDCPGLPDVYGDKYEELYWKYVNENKFRNKVKARKLWMAILDSQIETGMPYIGFKDAVNHKTNQKNLGTIKSSNLCIEVIQYSDHNEYAVCNLASIALKPFVVPWTNESSNEWVIYTKPNCKFCKFAKNFLTNNNIQFQEKEFNNDNLNELKQKMVLVSAKQNVDCSGDSCKFVAGKNSITFPQIFINDKHLGGWIELYKYTKGTFDYDKLYEVAYLATINLNQVIDINYYPVPQTKLSNMKHRPIGLGIQGLADALVLMGIAFDSEEAVEFNSRVMETIYLAAMTASNDLTIQRTKPMSKLITYLNNQDYPEYYDCNYKITDEHMNDLYHQLKPNKYELNKDPDLETVGAYSTFVGSPLSEGKFQFDIWNKTPLYKEKWDLLREKVIKYGTRNSLLTALMPTASTSQILGNNECFEFFSNNIYTRKTQAGDFVLVNKYLVNDLININMWSPELKDRIIAANGSIQLLDEVPQNLKQIYKTMWEIKQIWVLKGAAARGPFVDQTQSMNIFMAEPDYQRLTSSHFWGWKNGLKTGMYYLRSKPSVDAIKFTIDPKLIKTLKTEAVESCESCSG